MSATTTIYADESGHSGADLLKRDDPLLVVAFVSLPTTVGIEARETLESLRVRAKLDPNAKLKFSRLQGSVPGRRFLRTAAEYLDSVEATVHIALVEKRYVVATMVVESFLDPLHNPKAPPENEPELRQKLADLVLEVSDEKLLRAFLDALRALDREACRRVGESFATRLGLHPDPEVRSVGGAISAGLSDFFWFGEEVEDAPKHFGKPNPVVHSFLPVLKHIHDHLDEHNAQASLVADEDAHFGPVLDLAFDVGQRADLAPFLAEFGFHGPLDRFASYRRVSEEKEPAIVFADVIAGTIRQVTAQRLRGGDVSSAIRPVWNATHSCVLRSKGKCYVALSETGWARHLLAR